MTPIIKAKNIGPKIEIELRSIGITTLEQLTQIGYQEAMYDLVEIYPHRLHKMCCMALAGAELNINCSEVSKDKNLMFAINSFMKKIKSDLNLKQLL